MSTRPSTESDKHTPKDNPNPTRPAPNEEDLESLENVEPFNIDIIPLSSSVPEKKVRRGLRDALLL